jgi:hypothetical protein
MALSKEQVDFFETFGFLKLAGALKDDIQWIIEEFEQVFPMFEKKHDGTKRTMIVPFIDQRIKLSALLDHPTVHGICSSLLGDNFNYMGSDGNYYTGETKWHPDGENKERRNIKIAFYLDQLGGSSGALRVIPGSHRLNDQYAQEIKQKVAKSLDIWGVPGSEVPAQVLDVVPGDLLVFDHNTFHSSWGGNTNRRMFTMNATERVKDEKIEELLNTIVQHGVYNRERYYGKAMMESAGPQRLVHLEQVLSIDHDYLERTKHYPVLR